MIDLDGLSLADDACLAVHVCIKHFCNSLTNCYVMQALGDEDMADLGGNPALQHSSSLGVFL